MVLKKLFTIVLLTLVCGSLSAQESHYQKSMRSDEDNAQYGIVGLGGSNSGGMTNGIYWSRVRDADDRMINTESVQDTLLRRSEFIRLCEQAYDAYEKKDDQHTVAYGDSALHYGYHTPELFFFMAISHERLGDYKSARRFYRHAIDAGYPYASVAYKNFKQRQKERKKAGQ